MAESFKVRAVDAEDIRVIAAYLQDAVIPLIDIKFLPQEQRLLLVASRFKWENCDEDFALSADGSSTHDAIEPCARYERIECGICFDGVSVVRRRGLNPVERERFLELLTIEPLGSSPAPLTALDLIFADGAAIRLEGDSITCHVSDLREARPTSWRPSHPVDQKG